MAKTYTPIATTTLTSTQNGVTFSSIPQTYTDLVVVVTGRSDSTSGGTDGVELQFNGDTGTNYSFTQIYSDGSAAYSSRASNNGSIALGNIPTSSTTTSLSYHLVTGHIMNYANTTTYKTALGRGGPSGSYNIFRAGVWRNTAAITSVTVMIPGGISFLADTTLTIYGIQKA